MKKVIFSSSKNYNDPSKNCGDCILIDTSSELVIFDCGCEEHAKQVENYMLNHNYSTAKMILSHNDADHFDGIPYLVDKGLISEVYTLLLLKYKDELLDLIDDGRRNRDSIAKSIEEIYDNIYSLSGTVTLKDIFTDTNIATGINIPGPDKDYALNAIAKNIDSRESDNIDKETIVNAVSTQVSITFPPNKNFYLLEIVVLRQLKLIPKLILQFSFRIMENWIRLTIYFLSKTIRRSIMFQIIQEIVTAVLIN